MRRLLVSLFLLECSILLQMCLNEDEPCEMYRIISETDSRDGRELTFTHNTDGSLQKVTGLNQAETNFFYIRTRQLFRIEKISEAMSKKVLLFDYDSEGRLISRYKEDNAPGDSMVFEYDDKHRMIKASYFWNKTELFAYHDIEYPG